MILCFATMALCLFFLGCGNSDRVPTNVPEDPTASLEAVESNESHESVPIPERLVLTPNRLETTKPEITFAGPIDLGEGGQGVGNDIDVLIYFIVEDKEYSLRISETDLHSYESYNSEAKGYVTEKVPVGERTNFVQSAKGCFDEIVKTPPEELRITVQGDKVMAVDKTLYSSLSPESIGLAKVRQDTIKNLYPYY